MEGGPQVNKFEEVSSLDHQREGACTVRSNASLVMVTWRTPSVDGQTRVKTLPYRNFVGGR